MLLIFGGLPASGKSTISRGVAKELHAAHIRVDTIEQALKDSGFVNVYSEGYELAYKLAADNLSLGLTVVADSVNPVSLTRAAWQAVARVADVQLLEIEMICSDQKEHQRRAETRLIDVENLVRPTWAEVLAINYETWEADIVIDTVGELPAQSLEKTLSLIRRSISS